MRACRALPFLHAHLSREASSVLRFLSYCKALRKQVPPARLGFNIPHPAPSVSLVTFVLPYRAQLSSALIFPCRVLNKVGISRHGQGKVRRVGGIQRVTPRYLRCVCRAPCADCGTFPACCGFETTVQYCTTTVVARRKDSGRLRFHWRWELARDFLNSGVRLDLSPDW